MLENISELAVKASRMLPVVETYARFLTFSCCFSFSFLPCEDRCKALETIPEVLSE